MITKITLKGSSNASYVKEKSSPTLYGERDFHDLAEQLVREAEVLKKCADLMSHILVNNEHLSVEEIVWRAKGIFGKGWPEPMITEQTKKKRTIYISYLIIHHED